MTKEEIIAHKNMYVTDNVSSLWDKDFESMAKKTVIKRLLRYAPLSITMQRAVANDERVNASISSDIHLIN